MAALHVSNSGASSAPRRRAARRASCPASWSRWPRSGRSRRSEIGAGPPGRGRHRACIVARRATFAAEVAGCQVEIGVAGAMAAAAVVEAAGGSAAQAADAAAIALQNTMGSVCDLVQGPVRDPLPHPQRRGRFERLRLRRPRPRRLSRTPSPSTKRSTPSYAVGRRCSRRSCAARRAAAWRWRRPPSALRRKEGNGPNTHFVDAPAFGRGRRRGP
ncbi:MAG: L-serine ammonia-lyase, iron-sulfur-dependent, subunit alpha [Anaerotruncus sp.]|nr:L-serine ammonia-lyase, iron-sulfur-dependent, subunit alpha [Anaerotruncus sp.]